MTPATTDQPGVLLGDAACQALCETDSGMVTGRARRVLPGATSTGCLRERRQAKRGHDDKR